MSYKHTDPITHQTTIRPGRPPKHSSEFWIGFAVGGWTGIGEAPRGTRGQVQVNVRCVCGNERTVDAADLLNGGSKSCGCMKGINIAMGQTGRVLDAGASPTPEDIAAAGVIVDGCLVVPTDVQLFWANTNRGAANECWMWTGTPTRKGYGRTTINNKRVIVHRLSYAMKTRIDPAGLVIRHQCNCRLCVNPDHLLIGTQGDNIRDAVRDGRMARGDKHGMRLHPESHARGERHPQSKFTLEQVQTLRRENPMPVPRGTYARLARILNVNPGVVRCMFVGSTWAMNNGAYPTNRQYPRRFFEEAWDELKASYGFSCLMCEKKEPDVELVADHVIPTSQGGKHDIENIQPLCRGCNSSKGKAQTDYRLNAKHLLVS